MNHEEWPALSFDAPHTFYMLSEEDKEKYVKLRNDDFCVIEYENQTDRYIRAVLFQQVINSCQYLQYGIWVSLSEKSYEDYSANYKNENHETIYFGWLASELPDYDFQVSIPTSVFTRTGNQRPEIVPHESFDHPFVKDYYNGITKEEAEKRIQNMLAAIG